MVVDRRDTKGQRKSQTKLGKQHNGAKKKESRQPIQSGRFAADMRVHVGGYGRGEHSIALDTDEHKEFFSRDHMEEGSAELKGQAKRTGQSRASLKRRKEKERRRSTTQSIKDDDQADGKPNASENSKKDRAPALLTASQCEVHDVSERISRKEKVGAKNRIKDTKRKIKSTEQMPRKKAVADIAKLKHSTEKPADASLQNRKLLSQQYAKVLGETIVTESGLQIRDIKIGQGALVMEGEMVTVKYRGRLDDQSGLVFGKGMLTLQYGTGSIIPGWEEALGTMLPGGIRFVTIPSDLAYGATGKGKKIPPNATLFFEIELVRIGKRSREIVGDDEIPLPKAFRRKKAQRVGSTNRVTNH
uniref:peptidylprolyl isomerase n=1 Tax=Albugo laibachii Nc14 TaxID=890382 RepID=F0WJF0_9STRA|nr:conserved hypothetical protein [Albugo laibachii Nc14]|eukprot:CCA21398.1 conserved hypothetical protein [Albugo laibachii Nc14]